MDTAESSARSSVGRVSVLGAFAARFDGISIELAHTAELVVAYLALSDGGADRSQVAGTLWPESSESRAAANLRATIWRMPEPVSAGLIRHGTLLCLDAAWNVDLADAVASARRLLAGADDPDTVSQIDRTTFVSDLLPSWDLPWLDLPRERHRQLRLHALELLADAQVRVGCALDAVDTAMEAVIAEPLRESAQHVLMRAHLAAGNRIAAIHVYDRFAALLDAELGLRPGPPMRETHRLAQSEPADVDASVTLR